MPRSSSQPGSPTTAAQVLLGEFGSLRAQKYDTSSPPGRGPGRVLSMASGEHRAKGAEFVRELFVPIDDGDQVRSRIIDAAYGAMLDFGIRRMTIEDVAKRAGIGRPTLYRRFSDKDALVRAVWLRESRQLIADVWEAVKRERSPEERIVRAFVVATKKLARHELMQRLLATEPETVLSFMTMEAGAIIDAGRALIAPQSRGLQDAGHLVTIELEDLLEVLARLFISVALTPSGLVSADDDEALDRFAERALLPLLMVMRKNTD